MTSEAFQILVHLGSSNGFHDWQCEEDPLRTTLVVINQPVDPWSASTVLGIMSLWQLSRPADAASEPGLLLREYTSCLEGAPRHAPAQESCELKTCIKHLLLPTASNYCQQIQWRRTVTSLCTAGSIVTLARRTVQIVKHVASA